MSTAMLLVIETSTSCSEIQRKVKRNTKMSAKMTSISVSLYLYSHVSQHRIRTSRRQKLIEMLTFPCNNEKQISILFPAYFCI